jgi:hypothetical protein
MYLARDSEVALWRGRAAYLGVPFIAPPIYHFTAAVLRSYEQRKVVVWASWTGAALVAGSAVATTRVIPAVSRHAWGFYPTYGPAAYAFLLCFLGLMGATLWQYWKAYRTATGAQRERIRWLLIGTGLRAGPCSIFSRSWASRSIRPATCRSWAGCSLWKRRSGGTSTWS